MAVVDLDSVFVRAIKYLHSSAVDSEYSLGMLLDEAIKTTYGSNAEFSAILSQPIVEYPNVSSRMYDPSSDIKEDSRTASSSDNELELDLLKEDLMCVVCKGMDVTAKNQLLECFDCHSLYHQDCHTPPIQQIEMESNWICDTCKQQSSKPTETSP